MRDASRGAALVGCLDPLDLERRVRGAHNAGDLDRDGARPDIGEGIGLPGVVAEEDRAALGGEVLGG